MRLANIVIAWSFACSLGRKLQQSFNGPADAAEKPTSADNFRFVTNGSCEDEDMVPVKRPDSCKLALGHIGQKFGKFTEGDFEVADGCSMKGGDLYFSKKGNCFKDTGAGISCRCSEENPCICQHAFELLRKSTCQEQGMKMIAQRDNCRLGAKVLGLKDADWLDLEGKVPKEVVDGCSIKTEKYLYMNEKDTCDPNSESPYSRKCLCSDLNACICEHYFIIEATTTTTSVAVFYDESVGTPGVQVVDAGAKESGTIDPATGKIVPQTLDPATGKVVQQSSGAGTVTSPGTVVDPATGKVVVQSPGTNVDMNSGTTDIESLADQAVGQISSGGAVAQGNPHTLPGLDSGESPPAESLSPKVKQQLEGLQSLQRELPTWKKYQPTSEAPQIPGTVALEGRGWCVDWSGNEGTARRIIHTTSCVDAGIKCTEDSACVAFACNDKPSRMPGAVSSLYTSTRCTLSCDNTEWLYEPSKIAKATSPPDNMMWNEAFCYKMTRAPYR